jgi:hypothetical protein
MYFFNLQNCCYFSFCIHYKFPFFSLFVFSFSMFHNDEPTSKKPYSESF